MHVFHIHHSHRRQHNQHRPPCPHTTQLLQRHTQSQRVHTFVSQAVMHHRHSVHIPIHTNLRSHNTIKTIHSSVHMQFINVQRVTAFVHLQKLPHVTSHISISPPQHFITFQPNRCTTQSHIAIPSACTKFFTVCVQHPNVQSSNSSQFGSMSHHISNPGYSQSCNPHIVMQVSQVQHTHNKHPGRQQQQQQSQVSFNSCQSSTSGHSSSMSQGSSPALHGHSHPNQSRSWAFRSPQTRQSNIISRIMVRSGQGQSHRATVTKGPSSGRSQQHPPMQFHTFIHIHTPVKQHELPLPHTRFHSHPHNGCTFIQAHIRACIPTQQRSPSPHKGSPFKWPQFTHVHNAQGRASSCPSSCLAHHCQTVISAQGHPIARTITGIQVHHCQFHSFQCKSFQSLTHTNTSM